MCTLLYPPFSNLLLPRGVSYLKNRTMISLAVQIYQAEDLPPMTTDMGSQLRQAFVGEGAANVDPYVEVCFSGFQVSTRQILLQQIL